MDFFNIGIGIVIGIVIAICFKIITKNNTNSTPAIRTCEFGYTINSNGSECMENDQTIPTICPDFEGSSYVKNIGDGYCYIKCLPDEYQKEFVCEKKDKTEGVQNRSRNRYMATCPVTHTFDQSDQSGENRCIRNKGKNMPPYNSCSNNQTLVDGKCYYF